MHICGLLLLTRRAFFFLRPAGHRRESRSLSSWTLKKKKQLSLSPSQSHLWWKLAPRFSFRSLPIVRCWRNGAYRIEIMAQNDSSFFLPSLTLSWSLIALSHRPKVRAPDFSFLIFFPPFWWFRFAFVVGWFCFFLAAQPKKDSSGHHHSFLHFCGCVVVAEDQKYTSP